jgi:hypothetical protein
VSLEDHDHFLEKLLVLLKVVVEPVLILVKLLVLLDGFHLLAGQIGQNEAYLHQPEYSLVEIYHHLLLNILELLIFLAL